MIIRPYRMLAALPALALAGCAGWVPGAAAPEDVAAACPGLAQSVIAPAHIGLASGAATIATAARIAPTVETIAGDGTLRPATPEHCRVLGWIAPLDPQAPRIHFQVNLPLVWNGKAVQYGGGGLNGVLVDGMTPLRDAPPGTPLPIARGYLTFGTDSGHQLAAYPPTEPGAWALNDEALANFASASYKKVRDVAVAIARTVYRRAPARIYYFGGSEGGREGLVMAQRFPSDYDGVVSVVPVVGWTGLMHAYYPAQMAQLRGGWLPAAKIAHLARVVTAACDALDGRADGVVNNYLACAARFDPRRVACGADTAPQCLTPPQLETVRSLHADHKLPFALANGVTSYPRMLWGAEDIPGGMQQWITGANPPSFPPRTAQSQHWLYGNNVLRYFIARDAKLDPRRYRPEDHRARIEAISAMMDATDSDLTAFRARGGKLIIRENMGDYAQSPLAGVRYFESVTARLGAAAIEDFMRLYASPASTHGGLARSLTDGTIVPTAVDLLEVLDDWVTHGRAPGELQQVRRASRPPFGIEAARPLCRYPGYPHYNGGDPALASSYGCRDSGS